MAGNGLFLYKIEVELEDASRSSVVVISQSDSPEQAFSAAQIQLERYYSRPINAKEFALVEKKPAISGGGFVIEHSGKEAIL